MPSDPKQTEAFLDGLNTSRRVRAAAFDVVHNIKDDAQAESVLDSLPFSQDMRANLWDLRKGGTVTGTPTAPTPASAEQFTQPTPDGSVFAKPTTENVGRFLSNAGEMLNPVTMAEGAYNAVRHPLDTASAIGQASGQQWEKAKDAYAQGHLSEAAGHALGTVPLIGPAAAEAGEQIASGDVAGGLGKATGLLLPVAGLSAAKAGVRGARAMVTPAARVGAADALEAGAAGRVADVMSPKVGPNKLRFGNQAERVAPDIAKDLAKDGAPLTREGLHAQVGERLSQAEQHLDAASDARLSARSFETQPLIDGLLEKRQQLTASAVDASGVQFQPITVNGKHATTWTNPAGPLGADVVPGPNAARVAVIDKAIAELRQLGPVTRYEPIRRIRQAYDGPAKAIYSPSMTSDYLTAQGGKLGAADVTGTLRERLAAWDPETAAANADYSVYRTADDVMQATKETERSRPRVGRQIMARLTGVMFGQQAAGPAGAVAGYIGGPLVDSALASGFTTKLKTAALMQSLADAIRGGDVARTNAITTQLEQLVKREMKTTAPVQAERNREATSPSAPPGQTTAPAMSAGYPRP